MVFMKHKAWHMLRDQYIFVKWVMYTLYSRGS